MKSFFITLIVIAVFPFVSYQVQAQEAALSIAPAVVETFVKPGKSLIYTYTIKNNADPTVIRLRMKSFEPAGEDGSIRLLEKTDPAVEFTIEDNKYAFNQPIILKTKDSITFNLIAQVPETEHDYYYSLIAQTDPPPLVEGSATTRARLSVGSILIIGNTPKFPADAQVQVNSLRISPSLDIPFFGSTIHLVDSSASPDIVVSINNKNTHFIHVKGSLTIGNQSITIPKKTILAETSRTITSPDITKPRLWMGRYTVNLGAMVDESSTRVTARTTIVAIPVKQILILGGIALLSFIIYMRKIVHKKDDVFISH